MRILLSYILLSGLSLNMVWASPNELTPATKPFAVVELFASEGCSSCPPADDLLRQLNQEAQDDNKNVFILSFAVDYWDYLGWKDPFSSFQFSQRQRQYAQALKSSSVYTPQIIVNGTNGFVGSDGIKARKYIEQFLNMSGVNSIEIEIQNIGSQQMKINYRSEGWEPDRVLNIALVEREVHSQVTAGENNGRLLKHTNVVREFKTINLKEKDGSVILENLEIDDLKKYLVIAYLQEIKTMKIVAASSILYPDVALAPHLRGQRNIRPKGRKVSGNARDVRG